MIEVRVLTATEARRHRAALAEVLTDCVDGGASVNFMAGFSQTDAELFFEKIIAGGERILLAAFLDSRLVGTVQIVPAGPPNQPHRADIAKLLVHRSARGRGVATQLMRTAEQVSSEIGRTLLVLDTITGSPAERLYLSLGWTKVGVIPDYCLLPDGTPWGTTIFYKHLQTA